MLVMTRRPRERIMIGDNIVVTIISVNGLQVKVAVDAPVDIPVHREEVYDDIKRAEREARGGKGG
jgi:carbon storage regulator